MRIRNVRRYAIVWVLLLGAAAGAQVSRWEFTKTYFSDGTIADRAGQISGRLGGRARFFEDPFGQYLELDGVSDVVHLGRYPEVSDLPTERITVEAVVRPRRFGDYTGIIGVFQDNGSYERGWVLGFRRGRPYFALASEGAKSMTYLQADQAVELGRWCHIVGTYDGTTMKVFVNICDKTLQLQAIDQNGILFDQVTLQK